MGDKDYPPGETPPPPLTKGPGFEALNARFGYIISMLTIPADPSLVWTPGTPTSPGRLRATATGAGGSTTTPPFTVVNASAKDAKGGPYPGRVRVYKGFLCNLRPAEMNLVDGALPDGTDGRCYLTMPEGVGYVYGKALIDTSLGVATQSHVYEVASTEEPDGTYLYLLIATVTTTNGTPVIEQNWTGNWYAVPLSSADGTILSPAGQ